MIEPFAFDAVLKNEAGWYCGDFHAHTNLSPDGFHTPDDLVAVAAAAGMDFVSFTDHNNIEAMTRLEKRPSLLIIPGCEITLKEGHYNIFGVHGWETWMEGICDMQADWVVNTNGRSLTDLIHTTAQHGYLNSINHPLLIPWAWQPDDTPLAQLTAVEIINDPTWPDNAQENPNAIAMWTRWLNDGHRITAIGGSDYHGTDRDNPAKGYFPRLHKPLTYVYAKELSINAIFHGVRKGWVYVSMGPKVSFTAMNEGQTRSIGDDLWIVNDERICFAAQIDHAAPGQTGRIIRNGDIVASWPITSSSDLFSYEGRGQAGEPAWFRLEVVDEKGGYQVVTNPIFVEWRKRPSFTTFGDYVSVNRTPPPGTDVD